MKIEKHFNSYLLGLGFGLLFSFIFFVLCGMLSTLSEVIKFDFGGDKTPVFMIIFGYIIGTIFGNFFSLRKISIRSIVLCILVSIICLIGIVFALDYRFGVLALIIGFITMPLFNSVAYHFGLKGK